MTRTPLADRPLPFIARGARAATLALCVAAAGLSACGGPTRAVESFKPTRVVVLGDELSRIEADGSRYGINALESDGITISCTTQPVWSQSLASAFGLSLCPAQPSSPARLMQAQAGADAAALAGQVNAVELAAPLGAGDLVTVLIGYNDVRTLHGQRAVSAEDPLVRQAEASGRVAAAQVCRVLARGARVVVATVPDLGLSPFGRAQSDAGRLLSLLTDEFNRGLRVGVSECRVNGQAVDGWQWGLLLGDEKIRQAASLTTLANVTEAACADGAVPPACTTATLKPGASASGWLWATDTLPSPAWHSLVGSSATSLAFYPF